MKEIIFSTLFIYICKNICFIQIQYLQKLKFNSITLNEETFFSELKKINYVTASKWQFVQKMTVVAFRMWIAPLHFLRVPSHEIVMHWVITKVRQNRQTEVNFCLFYSRYDVMNYAPMGRLSLNTAVFAKIVTSPFLN